MQQCFRQAGRLPLHIEIRTLQIAKGSWQVVASNDRPVHFDCEQQVSAIVSRAQLPMSAVNDGRSKPGEPDPILVGCSFSHGKPLPCAADEFFGKNTVEALRREGKCDATDGNSCSAHSTIVCDDCDDCHYSSPQARRCNDESGVYSR